MPGVKIVYFRERLQKILQKNLCNPYEINYSASPKVYPDVEFYTPPRRGSRRTRGVSVFLYFIRLSEFLPVYSGKRFPYWPQKRYTMSNNRIVQTQGRQKSAMIRFLVFDNGQFNGQISINSMHMFAQDEIPVRCQLQYHQGEVQGVRHSDTAIGLCTLWPVKDFGRIMLQTTRLPAREQPYILNLELSRGRLLRITQKREDWGLTDSTVTGNHNELIDESLEQFVQSLCHLDDPAQAARFADESLSLAMKAGEEMAMAHARFFLGRRTTAQGFGRHIFGCCFDPTRIQDQRYLDFVKGHFHFVTLPISWRQVEPEQQHKDFSLMDSCIQWLVKNRIAVKMGPLLSFSQASLPDWLYIWENDFEQIRELAYEYVTSVVERYNKEVQAWDVVSGLHVDNVFKFSFDQIIELTRSATMAAKRAAHRALVLIELTEPWGEYYAANPRSVPPMIYADVICQSGVRFDGFGIKLRFGRGGAGMRTRDLLELSSLLDRFAIFGKQIHLSGVQAPSQPDNRNNTAAVGDPGHWHEGWTENSQAEWLNCAYQIALSKPFVETITWQDVVDNPDAILQHGGLLKADYSAKPVFEKLLELKKSLVRSGSKGSSHKEKHE
jgi:hypothetical protein